MAFARKRTTSDGLPAAPLQHPLSNRALADGDGAGAVGAATRAGSGALAAPAAMHRLVGGAGGAGERDGRSGAAAGGGPGGAGLGQRPRGHEPGGTLDLWQAARADAE